MTSVWQQLVVYLQTDLPGWLRRAAADPAQPAPPAAPESMPLAPRVRHGAMRRRVTRAVARLPPVYVNVLVLADVQGRSYAEVGEALGLGPGAAQGCVRRARALLYDDLAGWWLGHLLAAVRVPKALQQTGG